MLVQNLAIASGMMVLNVAIHFFGLAGLIAVMRTEFRKRLNERSVVRQGVTILLIVLALVVLHTVEIWTYAFLYMALGEIPSLEDSLYFSTVSFTTVGYGDVVISHKHRLISAIEAANGFLLIGWSTAFLVSVTARIGILEAAIERGDD